MFYNFREKTDVDMKFLFRTEYNPEVDKVLRVEEDIKRLEPNYIKNFKDKLIAEHKIVMDSVKQKRQKEKEDKEAAIRHAQEVELKRIEDQKVRREDRRIKRIESIYLIII
jgi:alpha-galactosidase/6-phospho-beta-glucosidase family protein